MHAVASGWQESRMEFRARKTARERAAERWRSPLDERRQDRDDVPVMSPMARSRRVKSSATKHEDNLIRMLYEEHARPLLMFALRLTGGDRQRAEDIVQETLLRAWRNAHRLGAQGHQSLRPWLITVARRIAIDDHRSERARPTEEYDRDLENFAESDSTDRVLRTITVTNALRTLSQPHREILIETYFRGRTVPEAAKELGLLLGTAKSRVYYALRALRSALQKQGVTG